MANPASFTINELTADAAITFPATQAVDTTGTVPILAKGDTGRLVLEVLNLAGVGLTVAIKAGVNPPALRSGLGDLSVAMAATGSAGDKKLFGPFESARFAQADGSVNVSFTPASGSPNATVTVRRLPKG